MAIDDFDDNDVADFVQALHGDAWVRSNPSGAVKVLLETGALEQHGYLHSSSGVDAWCPGAVCEIPDCAIVPVYRLVTEENSDGE